MRLQLTQHGTTGTIETKGDGQTGDTMAQHCRELLLGQGYHWQTVYEAMPSEEDVVEQIQEALEVQKNEDFTYKGVYKDAGLTEDCGNI